jgi:Fic family protein
MFVVAEVHPFTDGNGRTARLAMNQFLTQAGLTRIIIPTVYRNDYRQDQIL